MRVLGGSKRRALCTAALVAQLMVHSAGASFECPSDLPFAPVDTELPITGVTLTKEDIIEKYGRFCTTGLGDDGNATCCGIIKFHDTWNGIMVETYRKDAMRKGGYCAGGTFLPGFPGEQMWGTGGRIVIYGIAMVFCFLGVAIIADRFMVAIEVITSKERTVNVRGYDGELEEIKVQVWNATISNLTLMALGSSAPEILLAVIETVTTINDEPKEGLGPSCIVGSAAFNLLVISAICVMAIPKGDSRRIKQLGVYNITAFFSVFAYVWMYVVLGLWTPNEVTPTEAWITLLLFPLLVLLSYFQDRGWIWCRSKSYKIAHSPSKKNLPATGDVEQKITVVGEHSHGHFMHSIGHGSHHQRLYKQIMEEEAERLGVPIQDVDHKLVAEIAARRIDGQREKSRAHYRIRAGKKMMGARRVGDLSPREARQAADKRHEEERGAQKNTDQETRAIDAGYSVLDWSASHTSVFENEKYVNLTIARRGNLDKPAEVKYETSSGTAMAGVDYDHVQGVAKFAPGVASCVVKVGIIDDNEYEPDENFYCRLYDPSDSHVLGSWKITEVTIINDDDPGEFSFESAAIVVSEDCGKARVAITRKNGCDGNITLKYRTHPRPEGKGGDGKGKPSDSQAVPGADYQHCEGKVNFLHQETQKVVEIDIVNTHEYEKEKIFMVTFDISEFPACGAKYGAHKTCAVRISPNEEVTKAMDKVADLVSGNLDALRPDTHTWYKQFEDAVSLHAEDGGEPACMDVVMHILTFFWKVIFATVPPTDYCGGWMTFVVSLAFIGILTGIVGDICSVFGCLIGLSAPVTAITFVALGTSLPDTFASKQAAEEADSADASIGNVTGSNSVNVFLGQGLPWVIATLWKGSQGEKYIVMAGSLSFSVIVFCICAVVCLGWFFVRRKYFGGELGGHVGMKYVTAVFYAALWVLYITLSSLKAEGVIA